MDSLASHSIKIQKAPTIIMAVTTTGSVKTSWGKQIEVILPMVSDPEGDPINIQFIDRVNRRLPFYVMPHVHGWFKLVSETLVEGKNAVQGSSTVTASWSSYETGQGVTFDIAYDILSTSDYQIGILNGTISENPLEKSNYAVVEAKFSATTVSEQRTGLKITVE